MCVKSRDEARQLGAALQALLADVTGDTVNDDVIASVAIVASRTAPVSILGIPFGGDNHFDTGLADEIEQTTTAVSQINNMWSRLSALGVADQVTYAQMNVFGRNLILNNNGGRNHNPQHSVMLMFGPKVKAGVTGDVRPTSDVHGGEATGINSTTGRPGGADISREDTLASATKTLMKACGLADGDINSRVTTGKIVTGSLV